MNKNTQWLMCPPTYYSVDYVINPWMEGNIGLARQAIAEEQWNALYDILSQKSQVHLIKPQTGVPDMTFTANAGLVVGKTFIPSLFRFPQRRLEEPYYIDWFRNHDYQINELEIEGSFEGEGDALFQSGREWLWAGYEFRSSLSSHKKLQEILNMEVVSLQLTDLRFYHFDTCFSPLPEGKVIYYPPAFDARSIEIIHQRVPAQNRYAVSAEDAGVFACNGIVCEDTFICNAASETLIKQLKSWGLQVVTTPLNEFILAGGAAKCLCLALAHE